MGTRIAFIIDTITSDTEGTQKQLLEMIRRLNRDEFDPLLVCLTLSTWMEKNTLPCPCITLGYKGFLKTNFPWVVARLVRELSSNRIDIVQTFFEDSIFVTWLAAAFSRRRPIMLSSRRDIGLGQRNRPWYHAIFQRILPFINIGYTGIVANSDEVRRYVARRERVPLGKIKVHYNGVGIPIAKVSSSPPEVFQKYPGAIWLGMVASLTPVKRHELLIRALGRAIGRSNLHLLLLGDGPLRDHLEALSVAARVRERIHFCGAVQNVDEYLDCIDIGVLCSDREGLSNAILEYMAYGKPVIATSVGGNCELVDETNGIVVPAGDEEALSDALVRLAADRELRTKLGGVSRQKVERSFSWDQSMMSIETYYRSLVARRTPLAEVSSDE